VTARNGSSPDLGRAPAPGSETLLLNLSGGVDSVYAAWKLLEQGHRLILHHCVLRNREGRHDVEARAVREVASWLRDHRLRAFTLLESGYDHGNLGRLPYDVEVVGFLTGVVLRDPSRRNIDTVVVSANSADATVTAPTTARIVRRRQLAEVMVGRKLNWWVPFAHVSKAAMVAEIPPALLRLCWWCRRPRGSRPCRQCRTCREINALPQVRALPSGRVEEAAV
jgi:7-cyano-7-deazaguanine synthase in queuosine biosynthesis